MNYKIGDYVIFRFSSNLHIGKIIEVGPYLYIAFTNDSRHRGYLLRKKVINKIPDYIGKLWDAYE